MRFTDGYWKVREDCSLYQAASAGEIEIGEDSVTIYASGVQNGGRKDLGGITLTVTFFSPAEDCIGVRAVHHFGDGKQVPAFYKRNGKYARIHAAEEEVVIRSGNTEARITRGKEWKVEFFHDDRKLTQSGWRSLGYAVLDSGECYTKEELQLSVGENIFGLGERFTPFIKNGQSVEIWNRDGGTSSEQSYKNIPFYLSDRDYGVLVHDSGKVSLEVGSEKVERVQFSVPGESLEYCVIGADSIAGVLRKYNKLTGMPTLPPAWSFGLWLTTSFTTDYDEKTVTHFIDGMSEREIPLQVFHFDCFWMRGGHWCDFLWDSIQRCAQSVGGKFGAIDVVINNAGVLFESDKTKRIMDVDVEVLHETMAVNTEGPILVLKAFYPLLQKSAAPRFYVITSEGRMSHHWHGMPVYSLSKVAAGKAAGIIDASVEEKFQVLAIHPGRMDTDMGHESAQIRPEEAAEGIFALAVGYKMPESWYVDYLGRKMEA